MSKKHNEKMRDNLIFYSPSSTDLNLHTCVMSKNAFGLTVPMVGFSISSRFGPLHNSLVVNIENFEILFGDDDEYRPFIPEVISWVKKNQSSLMMHWNGDAIFEII